MGTPQRVNTLSIAALKVVPYANCFTKIQKKTKYDKIMTISSEAEVELDWWINNIHSSFKSLNSFSY